MLLNLWNSNGLVRDFIQLYNLTGEQMCNILRRLHCDPERDNVRIFCEETEIKLDEIDVSHTVEFLGKIVSTTIDDFECLKQMGIVPLDFLLENDTPISRHLKKYQIEIKPSMHTLIYKEKAFYLPCREEECSWCAYDDEQCRYSGQRYKDIWCSYLSAISTLATKLYRDNAEIELFLLAPKDNMLSYSTVQKYPEIFVTIEHFIRSWFGENLGIGNEWAELKQHTYIATVCVKYDEMSYRTNYISAADGADANDILGRYDNFCGEKYDWVDQVPDCFWDNIWLINTCLDLIYSCGEATQSICAGIKHDIVFPYADLEIDLIR